MRYACSCCLRLTKPRFFLPWLGILAAGSTVAEAAGARAAHACALLQAPERVLLSAAGEMALMRSCGELPAIPAVATEPVAREPRVPAPDGLVNLVPDPLPSTTQSEVSLDQRPGIAGGPATMVAAWNDSTSQAATGVSFNGYAVSTDGGASWTDRGPLLPIPPITASNSGDPWIRAHKSTGNFFYASLSTDIAGASIIGVYTGVTPGAAPDWPAAANVTPGQPAGTFEDKEAMDVDNSGGTFDGRVYVCWRQFGAGTLNIKLSRNVDAGADLPLTHLGIVDISPIGANNTQGCYVEVDQATGDVYVAWEDFAVPRTIQARRSTDGGVSFGATATVTTVFPIGHSATCAGTPRQVMLADIRVTEFISSMAVNPITGNLHVVYASDSDGPSPGGPDEGDVYHVRCSPDATNGLGMCTVPFRLNSDVATTNDQWHPFIDASPDGNLAVFWYDRRHDPMNFIIEVIKRFSTDDGVTWTTDEVVTDVPFGVPSLNPNFDPLVVACYMGEYNHITSDDSHFYFAWGDNRLPVGMPPRPDPDVWFEKEAIPKVTTGTGAGASIASRVRRYQKS